MTSADADSPQGHRRARGQPTGETFPAGLDTQKERLDRELTEVQEVRAAVGLASTVKQAKEIKDRAETMEHYANRAGRSETLQQHWLEIRLRAERKAGELLAQEKLSRGGRPPNPETSNSPLQVNSGPTLEELGVTRNQSWKWQKLATIPAPDFEAAVVAAQSEAELLRLANKLNAPPAPPPPKPPEPGQQPVDPSPFAPEKVKRKCFCQGEILRVVDLGTYEALYEASTQLRTDSLGETQSAKSTNQAADHQEATGRRQRNSA